MLHMTRQSVALNVDDLWHALTYAATAYLKEKNGSRPALHLAA